MLFNSLSFAVFFPAVVISYFVLPQKWRTFFLLAASCVFYMAFVPKYILILFALITLDFFLAQTLVKHQGKRRFVFLWMSIFANLGMLFFFKYFNFFNVNVAELATFLHWNYSPLLLQVALPIGLSFHIFQSLSYVIEVYKGRYEPERGYFGYALYVMFFPQLVAGPIERPGHLLPQLHAATSFDAGRARKGVERMLWGFFKKIVIADNIGVIVSSFWMGGLPTDGPTLIILAALFTFQLYCDFSGYADIAIGSAMVLGVDLMENFNRPFASRSMGEFWRRWHISLSNWLRDYLYYPLVMGWGKASAVRLYASLVITFVLIGLWHGANWTFVVFGLLNGIYQTIGLSTARIRARAAEFVGLSSLPRLHHALQVIITFSLFSFCLIFFRAENMNQAWQFVSHLGSGLSDLGPVLARWGAYALSDKVRVGVFVFGICIMEAVQYWQAKLGTFYIFDSRSRILRYGWYYALVVCILVFGYFKAQPFIYFQF